MAQVLWPKGPEPMSRRPFKVGFQNIHRGIANANIILEEGVKRDWDVIFLAEPWVEKKAGGWAMTVQAGLDMISTLTQDTKLVAYVNIKHRQGVEKKEEDPNWCVLRVGRLTSAGVYMSKEWTVQKYGQVAAHLGGYWRRGRKALVVGDWNAHYTLWGSATNDGKGKEIKKQMESRGGLWLGIRGEGTFRRMNGNQVQESTLDMAWQGPEDDWQMTEWFWTGSDHKAISFQTSTKETGPPERKVIDWLRLKLAVEEGDWTPKVREAWWRSTPGKTVYDKLLTCTDNNVQDGSERTISTTTRFPTSQKTANDREKRADPQDLIFTEESSESHLSPRKESFPPTKSSPTYEIANSAGRSLSRFRWLVLLHTHMHSPAVQPQHYILRTNKERRSQDYAEKDRRPKTEGQTYFRPRGSGSGGGGLR